MKMNIAKSRLRFCLFSLVLATGIFNLNAMADGPGPMPTGGSGGGGVRRQPMPSPPVNGVRVVASSLNVVTPASGAGQKPLVTGVLDGPGPMPTGPLSR